MRRFRPFGDKREICRVQDPEAVVQFSSAMAFVTRTRPNTTDLIAGLHSHPFDYADTRLCGDDARQPEAGGFHINASNIPAHCFIVRSLSPTGQCDLLDRVTSHLIASRVLNREGSI